MNLSTKQKVVKSYAVEVAGPCLVDCQFPEFAVLSEHVAVLAPKPESAGDVPANYETGHWPVEAQRQAEAGAPVDEGQVIVARAKAEAEALLAKAKQEAEEVAAEIRRQAEEDVQRRREALAAEVRAEVLPRAREEGFQAGLAEAESLLRARQEDAERLVRLAEAALRAEYARVDEQLLQLSLKIAERMVRGTLAVEPERLLTIVRSLALLPQEREGLLLHVAPEDGAWLSTCEPESLPCPWVVDGTLRPGECFLETQEGIFSAEFEAELAKFEKILREELKRGRLEPAAQQG